MNIMAMMKIKNTLEGNHPKAGEFVKRVLMTGIPEGTILELTVTKPGEEPKTTNIKVQQSDLDAIAVLKDAAK